MNLIKGLLVNKPRGHKQGGGGTQKDHVMGTWGGGGLVWVQICPRGLFTEKSLWFIGHKP